MKQYLKIGFSLLAILAFNVAGAQTAPNASKLAAIEFSNKLKQLPDAPVIDVRTPEEFTSGHLAKSKNIDWYSSEFVKQISTLDKSKPVFIYCKSGGRSASAVSKMTALGFKQIYELEGGITAWNANKLPVVK